MLGNGLGEGGRNNGYLWRLMATRLGEYIRLCMLYKNYINSKDFSLISRGKDEIKAKQMYLYSVIFLI